eukprot:3507049-Prorocentrum_lima.AAC.1
MAGRARRHPAHSPRACPWLGKHRLPPRTSRSRVALFQPNEAAEAGSRVPDTDILARSSSLDAVVLITAGG